MARAPLAARAAAALLAALALFARINRAHAQASSTGAPAQAARAPTLAIALSIKSRAIQDSRCYLMSGGAVESFFVSEDMPVGSVIGTLSVNGDPSETGDITLSVQERAAAVGISPGTKNVTLLRALDREEKGGPSNVYVNVRCDRRRTSDPSFVIPVSVRVWDVNDNSPEWVGAPYRVRLSELTAVGSRVLPGLRATDADQPGPHATIRYSVLPGTNSEYFSFPNELESALILSSPLDYESVRELTVRLRAADGGHPPRHNDTTLTVHVLDADDQNPKFTHEHYTAIVPDEAEEGSILSTLPGPISAIDQDVGINAPLQYSATGEGAALVGVEGGTGRVAVGGGLLRARAAGDLPLTIVIKATQVDNPDRYALATLTIGRQSSGALSSGAVRFTRRGYHAAVAEDTAVGAVLLVLATEPLRPPREPPLQFYVSERSFLEQFAINSAGEVLLRRALDYEVQDSYYYQVMVTDGRANDTASLNITVLNVNEWEPRFRFPHYEFRVEPTPSAPSPSASSPAGGDGEGAEGAGEGLLPVGKLDVHDGDKPDTVSLTLRGSDASMLLVLPSGELFLRRAALRALNASALHVVATAQDSGAPPRQTSVPVVVHVSPRLLPPARPPPLVALFAGALALLALLVLALLAYICRRKRLVKPAAPPAPPHTKPPAPRAPPSPGPLAPSGSLLSVSAGASTILANSNSSLDLRGEGGGGATLPALQGTQSRSASVGRQSQRFPAKSKIAPLPPSLAPTSDTVGIPAPHCEGEGGVALMSDHLRRGAGRSGVAWPSATIPTRVKKLSWDDADPNRQGDKGSEPHDATNPALQDHMNLTVYF